MPSSAPTLAWVKSTRAVLGQDPLGVRAPSEFIYNKLIPGITNVTDRARYFSFYPWLIWAFEKHEGPLKSRPIYEIIRRADCLFTMIGSYHNIKLDSNPSHGALTGSLKLSNVVKDIKSTGKIIKLSTFASTKDNTDRYFMNKFGGLGQYYIAPLRDAGILEVLANGDIVYTKERGLILAEAFDAQVDRNHFF
jgi:hypothetical protein